MSDLFDDLDFEMLGGDFEDPFENEPVDPMPPPVPGMPNAGHQPVPVSYTHLTTMISF